MSLPCCCCYDAVVLLCCPRLEAAVKAREEAVAKAAELEKQAKLLGDG